MKKDEFNHIKIVNEEADSYEFGYSQEAEYTFYDENKNSINDEINNYNLSNDEKNHKKKEELNNKNYSNGKLRNSKINNNNYHTFITAVASIVSVTTLAILIGINIINARCNFNVLDVIYNSIFYSLNLENTNNDKFILVLENKELNYYKYYELEEGINEGEFFDLTPNTKYLISVLDTSFNNYSIYSNEIITPEFKIDFDILSEFDIDTQEIKISSSIGDNNISNIKMHITDSNGLEKNIDIEPVDGVQNVVLNKETDDVIIDMLDSKGFTYYFTYELNGSSFETAKKEIVLTNPDETPIEFYLDDIVLLNSSKTAQIGNVYLYAKEEGKLTSLSLHLISNESSQEKTYELDPNVSEQEIELNEINDAIILDLESEAGFKYYLSYVYDGIEDVTKENDIFFEVSYEQSDSFVAPTVTWDKKADFSDKTITISLSYTDPNRNISDIYLELSDSNSNLKTYNIISTTAEQKITLTSDSYIDITNGKEYHYAFYYSGYVDGSYSDREVFEEGDIVFEDYLGRETKYNGIVCEYIVASENLIAIRMPNFVDTLGTFSNIRCYFDDISSNAPYVELELNDSVQEFDLSDLNVNLNAEYGFLYMEAIYSNGNVGSLIYNDQQGIDVDYPRYEKYGISTFEVLGNFTNAPTFSEMNGKYYATINIESRDYDNYYDGYYLRFNPEDSSDSFDVLINKNISNYQYVELKDVNEGNIESQHNYTIQGIAKKGNEEKEIMEAKLVSISECFPGANTVFGINLVNGNVLSKADGKLEMFIYLTDNTGQSVRNLKLNIVDVDDGIYNPTYTFDVDIVGKDLSTEAFVLDLKSLDNYEEILEFIDGKDLYLTLTYTLLTDESSITKNVFYGRIAIID